MLDDNKSVPTFPNARYLLGRVEYRATQARDQIVVATSADSWKVVQRAEEWGFSHAWFYDTQMLCADCFVAMGAAAMKTSRIRLGAGALAPSNRIAPVTTNAFATLNKLAPGRIDFGVGTGFTARRAMGMDAIKLAEMEEYIRIVTADLIRTSTFTATQKELIERIGVMRDAGYTQFAIQITQGQEDSIQDWAKVMDAFRKI